MNMHQTLRGCSFAVLTVLFGCAGGVGEPTPTATTTFAITDAPSDDVVSFRVNFTRLSVTDADGTDIDITRVPLPLDLARLVDLSQIVGQIPLGVSRYVRAEVELDFDDAVCFLREHALPATLVAGDGSPLFGRRSFVIDLSGSSADVTEQKRSVFEFDFDLAASLDVDLASNRVVVDPALVLRVDRADAKQMTASGTISQIDVNSGAFVVDARSEQGLRLTPIGFQTNDRTVYQIDGIPSLGAAGFAQLAALPNDTAIRAFGRNENGLRNLLAEYVEAGDGSSGAGQDFVEGVVVGRVVGTNGSLLLNVFGGATAFGQPNTSFETTFEVRTRVGSTKVAARAKTFSLDLDDVNVGQRITAFGKLGGAALDARKSNDLVRLEATKLIGVVSALPGAARVEVELRELEGRDVGLFAWNQGGSTPVDPLRTSLRVHPVAQTSQLEVGDTVEASGLFSGIDTDEPDFFATSVRDLADAPLYLLLRDRFGGLSVDVDAQPDVLRFDLAGAPVADELAVLDNGSAGQTALAFAPQPTVIPAVSGVLCVLHDLDAGSVRLYSNFAEFSAELGLKLSSSGQLVNFAALGLHDASSNALTATLIVALID